MLAAEPSFANPLLSFHFAEAVGALREDAHVAVFRRAGRAIAFLPHHRAAGGLARPIGAPFSDYQALVSEPDPGLTAAEALAKAGLRRFRYTGLVDPWNVFPAPTRSITAYQVQAEASPDAALAAVRARSPEHVRTWLKQARRLARDHGEATFTPVNPSRDDLETVFAWKSAQLRASGLHDVLAPAWVRTLMSGLHARGAQAFTGVLSTLHVAGRLVAGNFGVRSGEAFHSWITSYDRDFGRYSPGSLLQLRNIEAMSSLGLQSWDLGVGADHFKERLTPATREVKAGSVALGPASPLDAAAVSGSGRLLGRLARRLDQIVAVEPTLAGRLRGLALLAVDARKRRAAHGA